MVLKIVVFFLSFVSSSYTANILAIVPMPTFSHQLVFRPIWRELSLKGHSVTLVTANPMNDANLPKLKEIDVGWSYKYFTDKTTMANSGRFSLWNMVKSFTKLMMPLIEEQLNYPPIQDLIKNKGQFDVVLVEHLYPEYLGFAEIYRCPMILVGAQDTLSNIHQYMGNLNHPVLNPEIFSPFYGKLSLNERIMSTVYTWYSWYLFKYNIIPEKEKLLQRYFNTTVSLPNMLEDVDLLILNVNPVLQGVRAVGPTTINIGGYRPVVASPTPLPKELQEYLDSAKKGFIYLCLGSNIKSKDLDPRTLNSILGALSEIPYKVLWKFEADTLPEKPENVRLIKWAPQQQVLAHPNIKLFVSHGGLLSMEEGVYNEVPFVVIPYYGDQLQYANFMQVKGIGKIVGKDPFIEQEELKGAILEVIQNPSYKRAVQKLKLQAFDSPETGLKKAIWWIEYVIRHNGTKHLRHSASGLPSYQYYAVDVISCIFLIAALSLSFAIVTLKLLKRLFNQRMHSRSAKLKGQ